MQIGGYACGGHGQGTSRSVSAAFELERPGEIGAGLSATNCGAGEAQNRVF
jgi:hypothetical protein